MLGEYGDADGLDSGDPRTGGRRSWMPLYLSLFLLVVVGIERLVVHVLT